MWRRCLGAAPPFLKRRDEGLPKTPDLLLTKDTEPTLNVTV